MTTLTIAAALLPTFRDAVTAAIRVPDEVRAFLDADPSLGSVTWTVDLTAQELATAEGIRAKCADLAKL